MCYAAKRMDSTILPSCDSWGILPCFRIRETDSVVRSVMAEAWQYIYSGQLLILFLLAQMAPIFFEVWMEALPPRCFPKNGPFRGGPCWNTSLFQPPKNGRRESCNPLCAWWSSSWHFLQSCSSFRRRWAPWKADASFWLCGLGFWALGEDLSTNSIVPSSFGCGTTWVIEFESMNEGDDVQYNDFLQHLSIHCDGSSIRDDTNSLGISNISRRWPSGKCWSSWGPSPMPFSFDRSLASIPWTSWSLVAPLTPQTEISPKRCRFLLTTSRWNDVAHLTQLTEEGHGRNAGLVRSLPNMFHTSSLMFFGIPFKKGIEKDGGFRLRGSLGRHNALDISTPMTLFHSASARCLPV